MSYKPTTTAVLAATFLLLLCGPGALAGGEAAQPVIGHIGLSGTRLLAREQVLSALGVAEGSPLDGAALQAAVAKWNESGMFGTIAYRIEPAEAGKVDLALTCSERVKLTAVAFHGNDYYSSKRLAELVGLKPGDAVSRIEAETYERQIAARYQEAGFPFVQVQAQFGALTEADRTLVFYVSDGPRVYVEDIVFEGNAQLPDDVLRSAMQSRARWWISFLRKGWLKKDVFDEDARRVEDAYHARGYLDAQAGGYVTYSDDLARAVLHVAVYEGELYRVKAVEFVGNTLYRDDELLAAVPLVPGEAFRPADFAAASDAISGLYARQGYMDVTPQKGNLTAQTVYALEGAGVTARFTIVEGEPVFIRRIEVRGLTGTKESVVRRNLTFYPGELASSEKMRESERVLVNTGYFDLEAARPVEISLEPDEGTLRDAIVQVREGQTGRFLVGLGLGSDSGLFGEVSLTEENFDIANWPSTWNDLWRGNAFRGGGQRLSLVLQAGTERSYYSIGWVNPAVGDSEYSFGTNIYSAATARQEFDETRTGASVTVGKRLSSYLTRSVTLGFESVDVDNVRKHAAAEILRDRGTHSRPFVRFDVAVDHRDNRFSPAEGYAAAAGLEVSGADSETVRLVVDAEQYWTVREVRDMGPHVLGVRGRLGMVGAYGGHVPVYERFYAGGFSTLRGFDFEGVSPSDPKTGDLVGGESMLVGTLEYSLPVSQGDRLRLVGFLDAGYVSEDAGDVLTGWDELRMSVGAGLRFRVPFLGPANLEVDVAAPVMKERDDKTQFLQFSIGASRRF